MQSVHSFVASYLKTADTQEPAADTQNDSEQVAATQEPATTPGDTQEPPVGNIDQIDVAEPLPPLESTVSQDQPTIPALQEEIEFLKAQI